MATYLYQCQTCNHEWEEIRSIHEANPEECPECKAKSVKRLINMGFSTKVELSDREFRDKAVADAVEFKRNFHKDENVMANYVGEEKYHNSKLKQDSAIREAKSFGKSFSRSKK